MLWLWPKFIFFQGKVNPTQCEALTMACALVMLTLLLSKNKCTIVTPYSLNVSIMSSIIWQMSLLSIGKRENRGPEMENAWFWNWAKSESTQLTQLESGLSPLFKIDIRRVPSWSLSWPSSSPIITGFFTRFLGARDNRSKPSRIWLGRLNLTQGGPSRLPGWSFNHDKKYWPFSLLY